MSAIAATYATQPETSLRTATVTEDADFDPRVLEEAADALLARAGDTPAREDVDEPDAAEEAPVRQRGARRRAPDGMTSEQEAERAAMITKHVALVRYVANSMARHTGQSVLLDYDDLVSYGTEGLIAAVDTFDAGRGLKFSTWAVMHIRTTIQDALRTLDPLPRSLRSKGKEIDRVSADLAHKHGAWPGMVDVAQALGQPLAVLRRTMADLNHTVVSLEQVDDGHNGASTGGDEGGMSLLNVLADDDPEVSPEERLDRTELSRMLGEAIAALPPREEVLIDAHYRQGQSMRAISRLLGISESRVSQLHARAVKLLREHLDRALSIDPAAHDTRPPARVRGRRRSRSEPLQSTQAA